MFTSVWYAVFFFFFQGEGGKHRALLIGINYTGGKGELKGCHNDVAQMREYIVEHVSLLGSRPRCRWQQS